MVKCGFRKILMPISVNQCGSSGRTRDGRLFVMNASDTLKFRKLMIGEFLCEYYQNKLNDIWHRYLIE